MEKQKSSYLIVNLLVAAVIILIIIYSAIFSGSGINHPIPSLAPSGVASQGLSRAFSEIVRGNISEAIAYNMFSVNIFTFFLLQLILRLAIALLDIKTSIHINKILTADIVISILLFLLLFGPFIHYQVHSYL